MSQHKRPCQFILINESFIQAPDTDRISASEQARNAQHQLRYNVRITKLPLAMTPQELQQAIEANTTAIAQLATTVAQTNQGVNFLVTEFIRPNTQQHLQSLEQLERLEGIVEAIAQQQQTNAQQIAANTEAVARLDQRLEAFDVRLEETRQIVAQNGSMIAQMGTRHEQMFDRMDKRLERNDQQLAALTIECQAIAEASRTQLAAIIGNGRRIDRLEQQAS